MIAEDELMTPNEAAARLAVNPATVRRWLIEGRIAGVRTFGGLYRIPRSTIEELATPRVLEPRHRNHERRVAAHDHQPVAAG